MEKIIQHGGMEVNCLTRKGSLEKGQRSTKHWGIRCLLRLWTKWERIGQERGKYLHEYRKTESPDCWKGLQRVWEFWKGKVHYLKVNYFSRSLSQVLDLATELTHRSGDNSRPPPWGGSRFSPLHSPTFIIIVWRESLGKWLHKPFVLSQN